MTLGVYLQRLGLTLVPATDEEFVELAPERVGDLQGEVLIEIRRDTAGAQDGFRALAANPLYAAPPAVRVTPLTP